MPGYENTVELSLPQDENKQTSKVLPVLVVCVFLTVVDFLLVGPLIPVLMDAVKSSVDRGGFLISIYTLFATITALFGAPLSDRWGHKNMLVGGIFVIAIADILMGMSSSYTHFLMARGLAGIGGALVVPNAFALVGDLFPYERRGRAMGYMTGSMGLAGVMAIPLGTMVASILGWQWSFFLVSLLAVFPVAFLYLFLNGRHKKISKPITLGSYAREFGEAINRPYVMFTLICTSLWYASYLGVYQYLGIYYAKSFSLNIQEVGVMILLPSLTYLVGTIVGGRISDRTGKKRLIIIVGLGAIAGALGFAVFNQHLHLATGIFMFWGACYGVGDSSFLALISELGGESKGTVLSINTAIMYGAISIITAIYPSVMAWKGFTGVGFISTLLALISFLVLNFFVREPKGKKIQSVALEVSK